MQATAISVTGISPAAASLAKLMAAEKRECTHAQTFPAGTHAMWLYYWLASVGVNPMKDVKVITVPPPQMLANMRVGKMDGYCGGESWGLLKAHPDYLVVAPQINQIDIFKQAATAAKASISKEVMRSSKMIDGVVWDGKVKWL